MAAVGFGVVGLAVVGLAVVGFAVVGFAVVGFAVVGFAVVGLAVVGFAVVGLAVVGFAVVGLAVVGFAVVGLAVVGLAVVGLAVVGFAVVGFGVVVGFCGAPVVGQSTKPTHLLYLKFGIAKHESDFVNTKSNKGIAQASSKDAVTSNWFSFSHINFKYTPCMETHDPQAPTSVLSCAL